MPHAWYQWSLCPWPGCSFGVAGIDFRLETINPQLYAAGVAAWNVNCPLVGPCPRCGRLILFFERTMARCVASPSGAVNLPGNWHTYAEFLDDKYQTFRP